MANSITNQPHHDNTDLAATKRKDSNTAVWWFVAAVFITVSPTWNQSMNVAMAPMISWSAAAVLTLIGFWLMLHRS